MASKPVKTTKAAKTSAKDSAKKTSNYKYNRAQRRWIDALKSGEFEQCKGQLVFDGKFCCLGVACAISDIPLDKEWMRELSLEGKASKVKQELKLRNSSGTFGGTFGDESFGVNIGGRTYTSLSSLNDTGNWSFKKIATFIEKNPEKVFTK